MQGAGFSEHWRQVRQTAPGGQGMSHLRLSTAALIWGLLSLSTAGGPGLGALGKGCPRAPSQDSLL
jgi:hypothetical protein